MNTTDLAREYSVEELVEAIALKAIGNAQGMLADFIKDPAYIKMEGVPTRQTFMKESIAFVQETTPLSVLDESAPTDLVRRDNESHWDFVFRKAVIEAINTRPDLARITVDLTR